MAASIFLGVARPAVAQRPTVGEQVERLARINRAYLEERRAYIAAERAKSASTPAETTFAGPLTVVSTVEVGAAARTGAAMAWQRMAPYFAADSTLLQSRWFVVVIQDGAPVHVDGTRPRRYGSVRAPASARDVADLLARMVSGLLADSAGGSITGWVGLAIPMAYDSSTLRYMYRELVTAPSQMAHRCFTGELAACRGALELDSVPDPATAWYGPAERELVVSRMGPRYGGDQRDFTRCTEGHDDMSCIAHL